MDKKLVAENIDFADSEYKSFQMSEDRILTLYLESWDGNVLKIEFFHTIYFSYKVGSFPSDLYEITKDPFLDKILIDSYGAIRPDCLHKLFQLEDIYGSPFIQVVAKSATVIKIGNHNVLLR